MPKEKGKKNRKYGRWSRSPSNVRYKAENRRDKNKIKKLRKHLKKCGGPQSAKTCYLNMTGKHYE